MTVGVVLMRVILMRMVVMRVVVTPVHQLGRRNRRADRGTNQRDDADDRSAPAPHAHHRADDESAAGRDRHTAVIRIAIENRRSEQLHECNRENRAEKSERTRDGRSTERTRSSGGWKKERHV